MQKETIIDAWTLGLLHKSLLPGTRVELLRMDDIQAPPPGTMGTITGIDDIGSLLVNWDNGSRLHLLWNVDSYRIQQVQEEEKK